ncbi:hypothetical protein [Aeromicrobium sp. 9AM]|uniref:hypothetical protein n=1 Tax=Aeromicrobium sp. 9AM TaxID=2653126 RepID=UPI0012F0B0AC|nr:hypothetical protein [Aeromicrobium sp. 9AM]VXC15136.1 hypothetical protein AERO9AM_50206 [Aeromicrobium sp. 9AM]
MLDPARTQGAMFQLASGIGFMLVTLPLALIFDVHQASADREMTGGPLRVGAWAFAWPVYIIVMIGAVWILLGVFQWSEAHDEEKRFTMPQSREDSLD